MLAISAPSIWPFEKLTVASGASNAPSKASDPRVRLVALPKLNRTWVLANAPRLNDPPLKFRLLPLTLMISPVGVTPFALVMLIPVIVAPFVTDKSITFRPLLLSVRLIVPPVELTFVAPLIAVRLDEALVISVELP